jgi:hypothetical protein
MPGYMDVGAAINTAEKLLREKTALFKKIDTVRTDLRNSMTRGEPTADQSKWIEQHFPVRERVRRKKTDSAPTTTS